MKLRILLQGIRIFQQIFRRRMKLGLPVIGLVFFQPCGEDDASNTKKLQMPFGFEESSAQESVHQAYPKEQCLTLELLYVRMLSPKETNIW